MPDDVYESAQQGNPEAQYQLGTMYTINPRSKLDCVEKNYVEAIKWYQKAAEQNHDEALVSLAWMYKRGKGVPEDYAEAVKLYWKATDLGNPEACRCLAILYENGLGVPKDEKIAGELNGKTNILFHKASARMRAKLRHDPRPQPSIFPKDDNWVRTVEIVFVALAVVAGLMQCAG